MFEFGSGVLLGKRTDITNATPVNFGLVQSVALDAQFDTKELYGQNQWPVAIARGKGKMTGKATLARISGIVFGDLFFGITPVTGQLATIFAEADSVPGVSTYIITVAQAATFVSDYGVIYATTGLPLKRVASVVAIGTYSVNESTGVYTFFSGDASAAVLINYTYNIAGTGEKIASVNALLGTTPTFQCILYTTFQGKPLTASFPNCVGSKLTFPTKLDDFTLPDFEFAMFVDAAGNLGTWSFAEAA